MKKKLELEVEVFDKTFLIEVFYDYTPELQPIIAPYPEDSEPGVPEAFVIEELLLINHKGVSVSIMDMINEDNEFEQKVIDYLSEAHSKKLPDFHPDS